MSAPPLLEIRGLTKYFMSSRSLLGRDQKRVRALDGVSLDIHQQETLGVVRRSEATQLPLPLSRRLMRDLRSIVRCALLRRICFPV